MKNIIILNKKEGETPLEALEKFRKKNSLYKSMSMTYAGRLDPMASGVLVVLAGEEIKNKEKYLTLDKEYEFEILFGFSTDTYDILGKIIHSNIPCLAGRQVTNIRMKELENKIKQNLKSFLGETTQKYPMYSSKTVRGKPLFAYAREGEQVKVPERKVFIKKLKLEKIRKLNNKKLFENIEKRIKKVKGDFRQDEILKTWEKKLKKSKPKNFFIARFKIKCSSGTYVRSISNELGNKTQTGGLAFSIKRTKVGRYVV